MKKNTSTAVIIPPSITNVVPKPTKAQLVEALLERARAAHQAKEKENEIKLEALEKEMKVLILAEMKTARPTDYEIDCNARYEWCHPQATIRFSSGKIKALHKKMAAFAETNFKEESTKKLIQDSLKTPNPLLGHKDTEAALDALLARLLAPQTGTHAIEA